MYSKRGTSIPRASKNNQLIRALPALAVIEVQRREGLRYIVIGDPHVTLFKTRDGAEWLAKFLG